MTTLSGPISCVIPTTCTTVECCVYVDFLQRSFLAVLDIDPCSRTFTISIERFVIDLDYLTYQWGKNLWKITSNIVCNSSLSFCISLMTYCYLYRKGTWKCRASVHASVGSCVCPSVHLRFPHFFLELFFQLSLFLVMWSYYEELQIKFDFSYGLNDFYGHNVH